MNNFSMIDSLLKLKNKKYPIDDRNIIFITENYDEDELRILSMRGLQLNNLINLFFYENVGFRCYNNKTELYGNLPICKNIENFMNNLYKDSFNK